MGCANCANNSTGLPKGCQNNGTCATGGCNKLNTYDWLTNITFSDEPAIPEIIEVKFKGTRNGFYRNPKKLDLEVGDFVVVDSPMGGYDIGHVSMRSELVLHQMKKYGVEKDNQEMLSVQRCAGEQDIEKYRKGKELEEETMYKSRKIAKALGLTMKISDVEYQGDLSKATFYYTADGRVDFRELIRELASAFRVKVEMKQIGPRQEAGRIGGIGSCGRELCCSTWLTDFDTVATSAARYQNLFINPQKLAGQCGRLKCCLNYELDTYLEALESFPDEKTTIQAVNGTLEIAKSDILKGTVWLSYKHQNPEQRESSQLLPFEVSQVNEFIKKNKKGEKIPALENISDLRPAGSSNERHAYKDVIGEDSLTRFEEKEKKKGPSKRGNRNKRQKHGQQGKAQKKRKGRPGN